MKSNISFRPSECGTVPKTLRPLLHLHKIFLHIFCATGTSKIYNMRVGHRPVIFPSYFARSKNAPITRCNFTWRTIWNAVSYYIDIRTKVLYNIPTIDKSCMNGLKRKSFCSAISITDVYQLLDKLACLCLAGTCGGTCILHSRMRLKNYTYMSLSKFKSKISHASAWIFTEFD